MRNETIFKGTPYRIRKAKPQNKITSDDMVITDSLKSMKQAMNTYSKEKIAVIRQKFSVNRACENTT